MSTSGYSGTPLLKKLGIRPGMKILLVNEPPGYLQLLENDIRPQLLQQGSLPDFIHLFAGSKNVFEGEMKKIKAYVQKNSSIIIWVSWYKKSSGVVTDINEDGIRNYALANGLVDIKVCAVNEEWSGLKLVVPKALR